MSLPPSFASDPPVKSAPVPRNFSGWVVLVLLFGLMISGALVSSFKESDPHSHIPSVQAGNLEAIVSQETKAQPPTKGLDQILKALPATDKSEDAAMVRLLTERERGIGLGQDDLKILAQSKEPKRRALADLLSTPLTDKASLRSKAKALEGATFPYRLAKAQALEASGDLSARYDLSPDYTPKRVAKTAQVVVGGLGLVALFLGVCVLGWYLTQLSKGESLWRGHPLGTTSVVEADALALRAAQFLLVFIGVSVAGELLTERFISDKSTAAALIQEAIISLGVLVATLAVTWVPVMGRRFTLARYGIRKEDLASHVAWGIGGFLAALPMVMVGLVVGWVLSNFLPRPEHPLGQMLEGATSWWMIAITFFLASVQAPITEELTFRGTMLPAFAGLWANKRWAVPAAIGTSSLLFASIHPQGLAMWLPLASVGVVNSVLCYQTRSVLPGIIMHALFNGSLIAASVLAR